MQLRRSVTILVGTALLAAPGTAAYGRPGRGPGARACGPTWTIVSTPNVTGDNNLLNGITALSTADAWAVGSHYTSIFVPSQTLAEHWNGTAWSIVPTPNTGDGSNVLYEVDWLSSNAVWGVGSKIDGGLMSTLVERWDGSSWTIVPSPNRGQNGSLLDVAMGSRHMGWAVGQAYEGSQQRTLIEAWNGNAWQILPSPSPDPEFNELDGVAIISKMNAWAVGSTGFGPLILHWDGAAWSQVALTGFDPQDLFTSVWASSSNDVWAVGWNGGGLGTFAAHWDGTSWTRFTTPTVGSSDLIRGVSGSASNDVWAVGRYQQGSTIKTLIQHWDGTSWTIATSPNGPSNSELWDVTTLSTGEAWVAGNSYSPTTPHVTLAEQYCP